MTPLPLRPMLASPAPKKIRFPVLASPKVDGVRAVIQDGVVLSRTGKPIPNEFIQRLFGQIGLNGLDGELVVGPANSPNVMQTTMSGVMTRSGEPDVTFWVFDYFTAEHTPYQLRYQNLVSYFGRGKELGHIRLLDHRLVETESSLTAYEAYCLRQGYEGIMLRDPNGPYKFGRSTAKEGYLLKLKRFEDGEAEVIGAEELLKNGNDLTTDELGYAKRSHHKDGKVPMNTLGSLVVRDIKTGIDFGIGTGFTQQQRSDLWDSYLSGQLVGRIVKYKHFAATGVKEAPRFPVFLGFRNPIDVL